MAGDDGGTQGIGGGALSVHSERMVSTSSMCEVIMGRGSRPILARWRSTAAMVAAVTISSANPVSGTGLLRGGRGAGVKSLISNTREGGCDALSRRLAIQGGNRSKLLSSRSVA